MLRDKTPATRQTRLIAIILGAMVGIALIVVIATSIVPVEVNIRTTTAQDNVESQVGNIDLIGTFDGHYKAYRIRVNDGIGYVTCVVVTSKNESNTGPVSLSCP